MTTKNPEHAGSSRSTTDIRRIVGILETTYGPRPWRKHGSGLDGLVETILSQNTSNTNSHAAFRALKSRFPTWNDVLHAKTRDIEQAIRSGGLANVKAPRIKAALRAILKSRGRLSLAFLARMPVADARAYLLALDGIGPKTANCVLMFCYNRPALPVDTHVFRVSRRLGLIPPRCTVERAHELLESACPPKLVYPFHVLMFEHGRRTCTARNPKCRACPLARLCPSSMTGNAATPSRPA